MHLKKYYIYNKPSFTLLRGNKLYSKRLDPTTSWIIEMVHRLYKGFRRQVS